MINTEMQKAAEDLVVCYFGKEQDFQQAGFTFLRQIRWCSSQHETVESIMQGFMEGLKKAYLALTQNKILPLELSKEELTVLYKLVGRESGTETNVALYKKLQQNNPELNEQELTVLCDLMGKQNYTTEGNKLYKKLLYRKPSELTEQEKPELTEQELTVLCDLIGKQDYTTEGNKLYKKLLYRKPSEPLKLNKEELQMLYSFSEKEKGLTMPLCLMGQNLTQKLQQLINCRTQDIE